MIEKVLDICATELNVPRGTISADIKFFETGMDSLEFVELMQVIEDAFWRIPESRWGHIDSPLDIERELQAAQC